MKSFTTLKLAVLTLVSFIILSPAVLAVSVTDKACATIPDSAVCKDAEQGQTSNPLFGENGVLTSVVSILSLVLGVIAVIVLIIAGIRFATSQGNAQSVGNVRNTVIYACVGIAVAALAQALVQLVLSKL